jgi:hypothetical protein
MAAGGQPELDSDNALTLGDVERLGQVRPDGGPGVGVDRDDVVAVVVQPGFAMRRRRYRIIGLLTERNEPARLLAYVNHWCGPPYQARDIGR